ncbi:MAG: hypothetical protein NVSMB29_14820 [Candidatus Dormibacteria bacterium]
MTAGATASVEAPMAAAARRVRDAIQTVPWKDVEWTGTRERPVRAVRLRVGARGAKVKARITS